MADLQLAPFNYSLAEFGLPSLRQVNVYVGATPAGPKSDARFPRPGLMAHLDVGGGPVWGMFRQAGTFGGDLFSLIGSTFYREGVSVGVAPATRRARFAASDSQVVCAAGGKAYLYDGIAQTVPFYAPASYRQIAIPDDQAVSDVAYLGGRFYFLIRDSDRFYWSTLNDAEEIDGLAFATAESSPDATVGIEVVGDELWFFGLATTEPWRQTGNIDLPIQRASGRTRKGCAAQQCILPFADNSVMWLADDLTVVTPSGRVSTHSVEAKLAAAIDVGEATAFRALVDGHEFYVINIPGHGSEAYDRTTGLWCAWSSRGRPTFRGRCGVVYGSQTYVGDDTLGRIGLLNRQARTDYGDEIELITSTVIPVSDRLSCMSLTLRCTVGEGEPTGNADVVSPSVDMRYSDDQGHTWSDWENELLGNDGDYRVTPMWRNLGLITAPGRVVEWRTTTPVLRTFAGAAFNEPYAFG